MKTASEKNIWFIASLLLLTLYLISEKLEVLIWAAVALIMFRISMIDEQIDNKFKT